MESTARALLHADKPIPLHIGILQMSKVHAVVLSCPTLRLGCRQPRRCQRVHGIRATCTWPRQEALGRLPYMVALDARRRCVVLAVRGTSSLSDALTDAIAQPCDLLAGWLGRAAQARPHMGAGGMSEE